MDYLRLSDAVLVSSRLVGGHERKKSRPKIRHVLRFTFNRSFWAEPAVKDKEIGCVPDLSEVLQVTQIPGT
jgi:hypothetical protein